MRGVSVVWAFPLDSSSVWRASSFVHTGTEWMVGIESLWNAREARTDWVSGSWPGPTLPQRTREGWGNRSFRTYERMGQPRIARGFASCGHRHNCGCPILSRLLRKGGNHGRKDWKGWANPPVATVLDARSEVGFLCAIS